MNVFKFVSFIIMLFGFGLFMQDQKYIRATLIGICLIVSVADAFITKD